jgi:NitT/TauT family transport system permease protein
MSIAVERSQSPSQSEPSKDLAPGLLRNPGRIRVVLEGAVSIVVVLLLWESLIRVFSIPSFVFPAPSAVLVSLWRGIVTGVYPAALLQTLSEILIGALIGAVAGFGFAVIMISSQVLNRLLYPWLVAIQTIPKVAIAPLMLVWFGFGIESKILVVALTSMFPVMINTMAGFRSTDPDQIALVKALCGNKLKLLRFVQFHSALPYIFAGLNTAIVLAVIAAIVAEFVGARAGIGYLILQANFALDLAGVFSLLVVLGALGVTLSLCMRALEKRICFWNQRS